MTKRSSLDRVNRDVGQGKQPMKAPGDIPREEDEGLHEQRIANWASKAVERPADSRARRSRRS